MWTLRMNKKKVKFISTIYASDGLAFYTFILGGAVDLLLECGQADYPTVQSKKGVTTTLTQSLIKVSKCFCSTVITAVDQASPKADSTLLKFPARSDLPSTSPVALRRYAT